MKWRLFESNKKLENKFVSELHIHEIISRVLANRGVESLEEADRFINVSLDDLHSPFLMAGMESAVERVLLAMERKEKIAIFGDYDVDGISATSLLIHFFSQLGQEISFYIPHRIKEGYGPNPNAIEQLSNQGVKLLITVDCGISSVKEVDFANNLGIDVIITDHHQLGDKLPSAFAILNPLRPDCSYPFKSLSGVGIAFKLITAIRNRLVEKGLRSQNDVPNLKKLLDLVALGTLADMVPLTGENHILVKIGIEQMGKSKKVGLRALMNLGKFGSRSIADMDVGFFLAPRLNAIGRLQNARMGVELLTTNDKFRAKEIAKNLDIENAKRQNIQSRILSEVLPLIESEVDIDKDKAIVLSSNGWHPGVIGIVASKVVEKFHLPTILLNIEDGVGRGSARSTPSFHIYEGLSKCKDLLLHFGGHKYAAGLSIDIDKIEEFKKEFKKIALEQTPDHDPAPELMIDSEVPLEWLSKDSVSDLLELGPFGQQNPYPNLMASKIKFSDSPTFVGRNKEHAKFEVCHNDSRVDCIGYGMADKCKGLNFADDFFDIVFIPTLITRGGMSSSVQLKINDFRKTSQ